MKLFRKDQYFGPTFTEWLVDCERRGVSKGVGRIATCKTCSWKDWRGDIFQDTDINFAKHPEPGLRNKAVAPVDLQPGTSAQPCPDSGVRPWGPDSKLTKGTGTCIRG